MLKIVVFLAVFIINGGLIYAQNVDKIIKKWDSSTRFKNNITLSCSKGYEAKKYYTANPKYLNSGSLKVKIIKNDQATFANIQLIFNFTGAIEKGIKYKIKVLLQSDQSGQIMAGAIMSNRPWSRLAKKSFIKTSLQANKNKEITIEFVAEKHFNNIRVPCLYLGKLRSGMELSIKSVVFERITKKKAEIAKITCNWQPVGPNGGGYVTGVRIDPKNTQRLFCISDKGGIHRSDNGGKSWTIKTKGFNSSVYYPVSDILFDSENSGRIYSINGHGNAKKVKIKGGIFRSNDYGDNWKLLTNEIWFAGEGIGKFAGHLLEFSPSNHNTIYAASIVNGLWVSHNAGKAWKNLGLNDYSLTGVWVDPINAKRIFVSARELFGKKGGLLVSKDSGKTWEEIIDLPVVTNISFDPQKPANVLAACNNKLMYSHNNGENWKELPVTKQISNIRKAYIQPTKSKRIWVVCRGNRKIFYSDDLGKNWIWPVKNLHESIHYPKGWFSSDRIRDWTGLPSAYDLEFDPKNENIIYTCDFYTVSKSIDGGNNWSQIPFGINVTCIYSIVCDPNNKNIIYSTMADIGLLKSTDAGKSFRWPIIKGELTINETAQFWINPKNSQHLMLAITYDWKNPHWVKFAQSKDGGSTWKQSISGLPWNKGGYLTGLTVLDEDAQRILISYSGKGNVPANIFMSCDGGKNWKPASKGLDTKPKLFGSCWQVFPNLASVGDIVYTATRRGVFISSAKDIEWKEIGKGTIREALNIVVHKQCPDWVWVGTSSGLYASSNQGKTFKRYGPKFMQRCRGVAIDPNNPNRWFVAVENVFWASSTNKPGVYFTTNNGKTFKRFSDMPCKGLAWRVTVDPHRKNTIYIGTNGTAIWKGSW